MLPLPFVTTHGQPLKVPAPFNHVSFRRHNRNQPERTQLAQRQLPYAVCDLIRARFAGERPDDLSPTNNIVLRLTGDTVPVNQRKAYSGIIGSDPCATFRLARKNSATIRKIDNRRWQRSGTRKFFVAIHCEIKATQFWDKGNRAHQLAHGYDTAAAEYCRHSRQSVRSGAGLQPRARLAAPMAKTSFHWRNNVRYAEMSELQGS